MPIDRLPGLDDPGNLRGWRLAKALIFLALGAGIIVFLVVSQRRAAALESLTRTGTEVQGRILGCTAERGDRVLRISYTFTAGESVLDIRDRLVGDFDGLAPPGPIQVWYDPADPRRCITPNELRHFRHGLTPYFFGALIVILMGLSARQAWKVLQPGPRSLLGDLEPGPGERIV
jgi:hypothetical protein